MVDHRVDSVVVIRAFIQLVLEAMMHVFFTRDVQIDVNTE